MNNTVTGDALAQAYEMIEADKLDEAKVALKPLLESDKDNPDVWWLYAHAVKDTETARIALNTVIRLDPEYPEAFDLLKTLDQRSPSDANLDYKEPGFLPAAPPTLPDLPGSGMGMDDDLDDDFEDDDEDVSFFQRPAVWMGIIGLIVVLAVVVVVIRPFGNGTASTTSTLQPTTQTSLPTTLPSDTNQPPTAGAETASDNFTDLRESLSAFTIPETGINLASTSLGNTLLVNVCTTAGRGLRTLLPQVMDALAKANSLYSNQANSVGVRMIDCDAETILLSIGVSLSDATAYTDGRLDEQGFQSRWTPIQ